VSTANAFILRGANIVFADSMKNNPNIDADQIEALITEKTKAIVPVHYAGIACDMGKIMALANKYNLKVVEDAAQALDNYFIEPEGHRKALGSIGHLAAFSFHETKNIIAGEGGMLAINDTGYSERAEIIWEKGTNRSAFFRGEVDKYGWVDVGSSFLPSEVVAAFLYAQLEQMDNIQAKRLQIWNQYHKELKHLEDEGLVKLPNIPEYSNNNAHMFYLVCNSLDERSKLIDYLRERKISPVFHYISLHKSPFYANRHDGRELPMSDFFTDTLVRLPLYYELEPEQVSTITGHINDFFIRKH
jgi:dTDP-4-amino-4,6-dideoxygalactose transaminase